ncbi:ABC transporter substrate-binding protein [Pararobbsia silviterrae]|uniref:Ethanolamine utilization protein EutJ n=1 Tax=Pararobbsia silviterrae TaxID=1792498 RepID=A0A494Y2Y0_9BURK|nr:ABC transporter substrate-binding protein [Pararobbsia silviterrae]RKP55813.1 ethanolamine utilization protein EutJ [Pararobbsia silviterrae]
MTMKRWSVVVAVAGALAAMSAAQGVMAQEVVHIGYSGPLSGGAAKYGKEVLDGMQMAADELNQAGVDIGGKKVKIQIDALDDKYNPAETAINVKRLIEEDKAAVVLVPHAGGCFAVQTSNEQQNLFLLAYTSVPQIAQRNNKLTVRIPPEFTSYIPAFVKFEMSTYGKKAAIAPTDSDYGKAWTAAFKPAWEAAGGQIVVENPMSYNKSTDFYSGMSRVLAEKPDVILIGGPSEPTGLVAQQARELGFKGGFAVIDQAKLDEVAKVTNGYPPLEGAIGVLPVAADETPGTKAFVARFRKTHDNRDPSSEVSLNYTAVYAAALAMKIAGTSTDGAAIRAAYDKALKQLPHDSNPNNISGLDDHGGLVAATPLVAIVQGGKLKPSEMNALASK